MAKINPFFNTQKPPTGYPALLRVTGRSTPLSALLGDAVEAGVPIQLANSVAQDRVAQDNGEDFSAIDPSLATEIASPLPPPLPGTSYAGLTPAQRHAFITWSRKPHEGAPPAYQQLFLANLEARLFEAEFREMALTTLLELSNTPNWARQPALHRTYLLACWLLQDGARLAAWVSTTHFPPALLSIALGMQALLNTPMRADELGIALTTWQIGARLPADLLKLRLDSLTAILGQPPLAHALTQLGDAAQAPRPWRTSHRGLRLMLPQPDVRPVLEFSLHDLLAVADVNPDDDHAPRSNLAAPASSEPVDVAEQEDQPSLEDLGWRLILEFGSNRSEYFDYVLAQAQKLPGYSQLMDEDRRIVYRIIFRKSEMRRFWRIWDYVNGWTATRVYLNGDELEKWKVWPYSQYLK